MGVGGQPEGEVDCPRLCGACGGAGLVFGITAHVESFFGPGDHVLMFHSPATSERSLCIRSRVFARGWSGIVRRHPE